MVVFAALLVLVIAEAIVDVVVDNVRVDTTALDVKAAVVVVVSLLSQA